MAQSSEDALPKGNSKLEQAMRYSVLNGGKRLRPFLVYLTSEIGQSKKDQQDLVACSVELIHCYSLIHDDLPSMDDDDLRRGILTCHNKFGEANAILAGDALQPLAFDLLCRLDIEDNIKISMISELAVASGHKGMVLGQTKDIESHKGFTQEDMDEMHNHKTGKLIQTSLVLGGLLSKATKKELKLLSHFGQKIGLAFQIKDDILDIESPASISGKRQGSDKINNKITYPTILGIDRAKEISFSIAKEAATIAKELNNHENLESLAYYIVERDS